MTIELDDATAAVLWDLCDALDNNLDEIGLCIRRAVLCLPKLEAAFAEADTDLSAVRRPTIPKLTPGRKYKPPTT